MRLEAAAEASGLTRRQLYELAGKVGVPAGRLAEYAAGYRDVAPWIARLIAAERAKGKGQRK